MSRRLLALLLVPALVGTALGVGLAADRVGLSSGPGTGPERPSMTETPETGMPSEEEGSEPPAAPSEPTAAPTTAPTDEATPPGPTTDIALVQQRLSELKYYVGSVDGVPGPATRSAVMAFQKVNGLSADGVVGPATLAALQDPVSPALRGGTGNRIEVDLTKQVLYLVRGGELERILPVSSGSGQAYRTASGGTARSLTPSGTYSVERRIRGVRNAPLGTLYDPLYFYRGWAIHGSGSVPAYPASHGCVRVTRADAVWLFDRVPVGTTVMLYGGTHTFTAGSDAAGTDAPAGDTPATTPTPTQTPTSAPTTPVPTTPAPSTPAPTVPAPTTPPVPSETPSASPSPMPTEDPSPSPTSSEAPQPTSSEDPARTQGTPSPEPSATSSDDRDGKDNRHPSPRP